MRRTLWMLFGLHVFFAQPAFGAALAHSDNFLVVAPDQNAAAAVLAAAEQCRRELAIEWLGEELPPSVGVTVIHVEFGGQADKGLAWPIDTPARTMHKIWLAGPPENVLGATLRHEITHVILATQLPGKVPAWADEGAASVQDDPQRRAIRCRLLAWYAETGNWPSLEALFAKPNIPPGDQASYAAAASITEYLLERGGKTRFLRFAMDGKIGGYAPALMRHYGIADIPALEAGWQAWVRQRCSGSACAAINGDRPASPIGPVARFSGVP